MATRTLAITLATGCLAVGAWLPAAAGPADSDPAWADRPASTASGRTVRREAGGGTPASQNAVELLVELQGKSVGLEFKDRKAIVESSEPLGGKGSLDRTESVSGGGYGGSSQAGLFGSGAIPMAAPRGPGGAAAGAGGGGAPAAGPAEAGGAGGGGAPAATGGGPGRPSLPAVDDGGQPSWVEGVVRWLREHRWWVALGGLGLLAVVGMASVGGTASGRR